jgi:hypothetical protein
MVKELWSVEKMENEAQKQRSRRFLIYCVYYQTQMQPQFKAKSVLKKIENGKCFSHWIMENGDIFIGRHNDIKKLVDLLVKLNVKKRLNCSIDEIQ